MVFNPTLNHDFIPEFNQGSLHIETMEEMKLLGLIVSNDLTWKRNTEYLTKKAYQKLWSIKRLIKHGASLDDIIDIYEKQVRSVLEFGVPVWNSGITKEEALEIERVQKSFLHIALGNSYKTYESALEITGLETLENRRLKLCEEGCKAPKT